MLSTGLIQDLSPLGLFRALDLIGVVLNGALGGMIARQKKFDPMGFGILAIISALGGGILRDVMLQNGPPVALIDPYYLAGALVGAFIAYVVRLESKWMRGTIIVADGLVLGVWSATGATKALNQGLGLLPALILGMMTAVGGGVIRDISVGQVPAIFGGNTLYATGALVASFVDFGFHLYNRPNLGMLVATVVGAAICVLARWRNWRLPQHSDWTISINSQQLRNLVYFKRKDGDKNLKGKDTHGNDSHGEHAHGEDNHGNDSHGNDSHGEEQNDS